MLKRLLRTRPQTPETARLRLFLRACVMQGLVTGGRVRR